MNAIPSTTPFLPGRPEPDPTSGVPAPLLTRTVGREHEIGRITELIDRDDVRLVSLLGPGGVGKTRLALEVTRAIAPAFAHGARFVRLDPVRDGALVSNAVAHALGFIESGGRTAADLMGDLLSDRHMLLVLDNMEQVIGAASPWLSGLLRQAPRLKVLVTSRIPLHIDAEHQFLVPPLEIPDTDPGASAAVRLFAERARAVWNDFVLDDHNVDVVAEICRSLDGLPLAIELAAARIKILSPEALLARLTNRLAVLTGGHHDASQRLRSMRDAIGWSYELLTPQERQLFLRLSVFLGGFTLEAAEFVAAWPCPSGMGRAPLDVLQSLVDQSLVQPAPTQAEPRYRMLGMIREYGVDQVEQHNKEDAYAAHADYVCGLARRAEPELIGRDQGLWMDRLDVDYANIRAAVSWLERSGRVDDAIDVYAAVIAFVDARGHTVEILQHLERLLALPQLQKSGNSRGLALYAAGILLHNIGDFSRGVELLEESKVILLETGNRYYAAIAAAWAGVTLAFKGDEERIVPALEEAIALAREVGHNRALSLSLSMLGGIGRGVRDERMYHSYVDQAAKVAREHGDWWMIAFSDVVANILDALEEERFADAETHIRESLRIRTMIGSKRDLPADWGFLAWAVYKQGDVEHAHEYLATALRIAEETDHSWYQALLSSELAILAAMQGDLPRARSFLSTTLASFGTNHRVDMAASSLATNGMIASLAGDTAGAARFFGVAETLVPDIFDGRGEPGFWLEVRAWRPKIVAALGDRAFRREYDIGASWTIEEAIREALRYVPPTTTDEPVEVTPTPVPGGLSPRELDVLAYMAKGMSNQQIADALFISYRTVTTHVSHIMTKLDVPTRTGAVSFAILNGIA